METNVHRSKMDCSKSFQLSTLQHSSNPDVFISHNGNQCISKNFSCLQYRRKTIFPGSSVSPSSPPSFKSGRIRLELFLAQLVLPLSLPSILLALSSPLQCLGKNEPIYFVDPLYTSRKRTLQCKLSRLDALKGFVCYR